MQTIQTTAHRKSYGNGFDIVTHKADARAFLDWWNDKSFYPVSDARGPSGVAAELPIAA